MIYKLPEIVFLIRICLQEDRLGNVVLLHQRCKVSEFKKRRLLHLNLFMYKQKSNKKIVNTRNLRTRAHGALFIYDKQTKQ